MSVPRGGEKKKVVFLFKHEMWVSSQLVGTEDDIGLLLNVGQ